MGHVTKTNYIYRFVYNIYKTETFIATKGDQNCALLMKRTIFFSSFLFFVCVES